MGNCRPQMKGEYQRFEPSKAMWLKSYFTEGQTGPREGKTVPQKVSVGSKMMSFIFCLSHYSPILWNSKDDLLGSS